MFVYVVCVCLQKETDPDTLADMAKEREERDKKAGIPLAIMHGLATNSSNTPISSNVHKPKSDPDDDKKEKVKHL